MEEEVQEIIRYVRDKTTKCHAESFLDLIQMNQLFKDILRQGHLIRTEN